MLFIAHLVDKEMFGWNVPTPVKFAIGVVLAGFGSLSLVGGIGISGTTGMT